MSRLSRKAEAILMKRLSLLIRSGMSVPSAVRSLSEGARGVVLKALTDTATAVEGGGTLAHGLSLHARVFAPLSIQIVRVGEESGSLAESLSYLATELEKQARLQGKLVGALVYPVLLAFLTLLIAGGLVLFIFPKVLPLFGSLGADLPLPTRLMLGISQYLEQWGVATIVALVLLSIAAAYLLRRSIRVQTLLARAVLRLPIVGTIVRSYRLSTLARSLGLLLNAGMPLPEALLGAGRATGHILYTRSLERAARSVEEGSRLRQALTERALYPVLVADILGAGEASGSLREAAFHLADYYENEFEEATRKLSVLVEPVLMIFMGLIVGFVAVSMILPIYSITDHLHAR